MGDYRRIAGIILNWILKLHLLYYREFRSFKKDAAEADYKRDNFNKQPILYANSCSLQNPICGPGENVMRYASCVKRHASDVMR